MGDVRFFILFNLAHAAIAFPTLRLWAEYSARRKTRARTRGGVALT